MTSLCVVATVLESVRRIVIVLGSGPSRRFHTVHTVMLHVILILHALTNWRQGGLTPLAKNAPSYLHYTVYKYT